MNYEWTRRGAPSLWNMTHNNNQLNYHTVTGVPTFLNIGHTDIYEAHGGQDVVLIASGVSWLHH